MKGLGFASRMQEYNSENLLADPRIPQGKSQNFKGPSGSCSVPLMMSFIV